MFPRPSWFTVKLSEYSRSEDSPDPWPCRQSRRCPNSQAVSMCPSCCTQKLYGGKTHTNTGVNYHPFPAFNGFFQKRELTHCQNLTRCYSSHCYRTLSDCSQLFCRHKRQNITTLYNSVTIPSGNIRRITICKQHPNSVAKQRESVLLRWALFNVWVICLFYKQTSQIFRSNWKQYNSFPFH